MRRALGWALCAAAGYIVVSWLLFGLTAWAARPAAEEGVETAEAGINAARAGDSLTAQTRLVAAATMLDSATSRLNGWWLAPTGLAPGVAQNRRALTVMVAEAAQLAREAASVAAIGTQAGSETTAGRVDTDTLDRLLRQSSVLASQARRSLTRIGGAGSPLLINPVAERLEAAEISVRQAIGDAASAQRSLAAARTLLGADEPRTYFVAFMTPSELRGSGGILGSFAELTVDRGEFRLGRVGRNDELNQAGTSAVLSGPPDYVRRYGRWLPATTWQNITMSPDFPSIGAVVADLYPQAGGRPIDGVIGIDPAGLAAIVGLTGPVSVPSWPEPLTASNLEQILLFDQYLRFDKPDRVGFLEEVAKATFEALASSGLPALPDLADSLGKATRARHIQMFSTLPAEQSVLRELGFAGDLAPIDGDFLAVVNQNASGSKVDKFLHRSTRYEVTFDPETSAASSSVEVVLENRAPSGGLPQYVLGPSPVLGREVPSGTNRTYMSVYTPLALDSVKINGEAREASGEWELGRNVYSLFFDIPPGGTAVARFELSGKLDSSDYRLTVRPQTFATGVEEIRVGVRPAEGWEPLRSKSLTRAAEGLRASPRPVGNWSASVSWKRSQRD